MTVINHPPRGAIVRVDLNEGFRSPEMVKRRPCIILSPPIPDRPQLCTIVPLSTSRPNTIRPHHLEISLDPPLPAPYANPKMWVKADIVLTVAFHRLRLLFVKSSEGQRVYDLRVREPAVFARVQDCVRAGLGL
jgi:mRNA interferase MazF